MPVSFYNDHYDLLLAQDYLFARKISPDAQALKRRRELYAAEGSFQTSNEGRNLFQFLTGQGRIGRRFGARFWETESTLGRERELMIVICKKWHVAKPCWTEFVRSPMCPRSFSLRKSTRNCPIWAAFSQQEKTRAPEGRLFVCSLTTTK